MTCAHLSPAPLSPIPQGYCQAKPPWRCPLLPFTRFTPLSPPLPSGLLPGHPAGARCPHAAHVLDPSPPRITAARRHQRCGLAAAGLTAWNVARMHATASDCMERAHGACCAFPFPPLCTGICCANVLYLAPCAPTSIHASLPHCTVLPHPSTPRPTLQVRLSAMFPDFMEPLAEGRSANAREGGDQHEGGVGRGGRGEGD